MAGATSMADTWFIHWPVRPVRPVRGLYGPVLTTEARHLLEQTLGFCSLYFCSSRHHGVISWSCQRVRQSHRRPPCGPSWFITPLLLGAINRAIPAAAADVSGCGRSGGMRPK